MLRPGLVVWNRKAKPARQRVRIRRDPDLVDRGE